MSEQKNQAQRHVAGSAEVLIGSSRVKTAGSQTVWFFYSRPYIACACRVDLTGAFYAARADGHSRVKSKLVKSELEFQW